MHHLQKRIPLLFSFCLLCAGFFPIESGAQCTGGDLSFASNPSMDTTYACLDGNADMVDFDSSGTSGANYAYLITDVEDTILAVKSASDMHDFEPAYPGECHVFGLAYEGTLNANPGEHVSNASATTCSDLSNDTLFALRDTLVGDTVWTSSGEDTAYACLDGNADVINFMNGSPTMTENYQYVITGPNDTILGLPASNMGNFEPAPPGECHVHGIAYLGELMASPGMHIGNATATECMDMSDQYLTVLRDTMDAGNVMTVSGNDSVTVMIDGQPDTVWFMNDGASMEMNYQYVITDASDTILGLPGSNYQNFEPAGPGECHVHGVAYLGDLMASQGMHISNISASECYDRSNQYITVIREDATALEEQRKTFDRFLVRPNPVEDELRVELSSGVSGRATVRVFDHTGRMVEKQQRSLDRGMNTYRFDLASLANGSYILRIESEKAVDTRKLIVH